MGKQEIWNYWLAKGYSQKAVASIMGNIGPESRFLSNNVEDRCLLSDEEYTKRVDDGRISRSEFISDEYGYGYYQHTLNVRKAGLYDLCKKRNVSISDPNAQHDWADEELHQYEYLRVLNKLKSSASIADMTREFMLYFEKPADQSQSKINHRIQVAQQVFDEFSRPVYWPPRTLTFGMEGPDVYALQGLLCARGYYNGTMTGKVDSTTLSAFSDFKKDNNLSQPQTFGQKAWNKLLLK